MSTTMDIQEIRAKYDAKGYESDIKIPLKLPEGYVFDEDISVKENRLRVQAHNQRVDDLYRERREQNHSLTLSLRSDVVNYIIDQYAVNEKQANVIESYVWKEHHWSMCDYFGNIDEISDFVEGVLLLK